MRWMVAMVAGAALALPSAAVSARFFLKTSHGAIRGVQGFGTAPVEATTRPYRMVGTLTDVDTLADNLTPRAFTVTVRGSGDVVQNLDLEAAGMAPRDRVRFGHWLLAMLGKRVEVAGDRIGNAQICIPDRVKVLR